MSRRLPIGVRGANVVPDFIFIGALILASISVTYAVITAPRGGFDLNLFQSSAREWVEGVYSIGGGYLPLYPPFAAPLFAPLVLLPFNYLIIVWLIVNLIAAFFMLRFAIKLYGPYWPTKAEVFLSAFVLCWAPFRVTLRVGQVSLVVTALLLGALVARKTKPVLAGVLLGLSLWKYSLTLPFLLYFIFKKEWRLVIASLLAPLALTEIFALRMGMSPVDALRAYTGVMVQGQLTGGSGWLGTTGATEIKILLFSLTGNETLTLVLTVALAALGLLLMTVVFSRTPEKENAHFAVIALFALWWTYHRTYDSVICVLPAALFIDFIVRKEMMLFSRFWLAALGLLVLSLPGLLTERLHLSATELSGNIPGWLGLHAERLLVFGMFWSLLFVLGRMRADLSSAVSDRRPELQQATPFAP